MTAGVRALLVTAGLVVVASCASMNTPPGGPDDDAPPRIVSVTPDSAAVNVRVSGVVFRFDEVINTRGDAAELSKLLLLSPMDGEPRISWRRSSIIVRPRHGWRANTTYTVTLLPGLGDLRGNRSKEMRTIVFSTGPQIATQVIVGHAFDWAAERVATGALVEARPSADTTTVYVASTDTVGAFAVGPLPGGEYRLRGYLDANHNRALDRGEPWDSTTVVATTLRTAADLYLALRDTLPPRIASVSPLDSLHLVVELDRAVDPSQPITPANFRVRRADSTDVRVVAAQSRRDYDRALEDARRRADTATARRDSIAAAQRDSVARATPGRPLGPPKPSRPAPPTSFVLTLGDPLRPTASYRIYISGIRSLSGVARSSDRIYTMPATPSRTAADSAQRAPTAPPRRP